MGTGSSSKAGSTSGTARPGSGHAPRTKVAMPGSGSSATGPDAPKRRRRPPAPPKPWYRQGRFWFAVIVLEVIVAFVLSVVYAPTSDEVALDGADLSRFCPLVNQSQALDTATSSRDAAQVAQAWGARADLLRQLQPVAPEALRPDLVDLVALAQGVQDEANAVEERLRADPSYDGSAAIESRTTQVATEGELAMKRLNVVALEGCGVDLTASSPSSSPASSSPASPSPSNPVPTTVAAPPTTIRPPVVGPTAVS